MGRVSVAGSPGSGLIAAACAAVAIAATLIVAPSASAATPNIDLLKSPGCPPKYKAVDQKASYDGAAQARALSGIYKVENHFPDVRLDPPVNWKQDPFQSKHWRNTLNNFKYLDPLFYIYKRGGSNALPALAEARDLMLDWIAAVNNPSRGVNKEAWLDKTVGDRTPYLAFMARAAACENLLSEGQASSLNYFLQFHGNRLQSEKRYSPSNRGLFQDFGLYLLSEYCPYLQNAAAWHALAPPRFRDTFHGRLDEGEGIWLEHSPGYQLLVIRTVEKFFALTGQDGDLLDFLPRMKQATGWLLMPDETMPQFGDTDKDKAPDWAPQAAQGKQGLHVFKRGGYAVVKQGKSYFALTDQFHNTDHVSDDDLSFELYDGRRVITDTGVYDKDIGRYRSFARSAEAHSVLTVDGQEFKLKPRSAFGSGITASGSGKGWYAVEGVNPLVGRQKVSHRRIFLYKPGTALIVIDRVRAEKKHRYTRYFQFGPSIDANKSGKGLQLAGGGSKELLDTKGRLSMVKGQEDPLQGWQFPAFRTRVPRWTAAYKTKDRNADYVTTISLNDKKPVSAKLRGKVGKKVKLKLSAAGKSAGSLVVRRGNKLKIR
jgi:Heparinase II/III-like protein/Heparinase II/III N-terminus